MSDLGALKRAAAERAAEAVEDGMTVGLGTGSTAALAVAAIGRRQREQGIRIAGVPTSEATAAQARSEGIALTELGAETSLDLTIDGADAVDLADFSLIKGLGGALLREKLVAAASRRMIVVVDDTKIQGALGSRTPIPVEIIRFGWPATAHRIAALGCEPALRGGAARPFVTDEGHHIVDCGFGPIADAAALHARLKAIAGVVETGLFVGFATEIIVAGADGLRHYRR
jgi:ribose 5-phosphate isomerase A